MSCRNKDTLKVALFSMPWAIFNRPSIQLASLQAYLEANSSYRVDAFHPYLNVASSIGVDLYAEIALSGWAGEALFSALLYPENKEKAASLFSESISPTKRRNSDFDQLTETVEKVFYEWLSQKKFHQYDLIGFSICFNQLLPSLYMAKLLKKQHPSIPIVFGGSSCSGEVGKSLLAQFTEIDYIIDGEGEKRLLKLCENIDSSTQTSVSGILSRRPITEPVHPIALLPLDTLPIPDYRSYCKEIKDVFPSSPFIPHLPVEFSRGCWWNKCTFCNLNIQWPTYRHKSGKKMVAEVLHLTKTYESLHFTFTDNALPPKDADFFFEQIAGSGIDLDFFAEIRGTSNPDRLRLYRKGGLITVQVGIEALSTSLLKKMEKGNSAMDNIAMMKLCQEHRINLEGNLIVHFPTTSEAEIAETLENLHYALPFSPLEPAAFFLGYGSPIYDNPAHYDICAITLHNKVKMLFPSQCYEAMTPLINGYRGDKSLQKKRWRPVYKAIADWQRFHENRKNSTVPGLSFRDGKDFLIIRQEKPDCATLHHRLRGLSRKIYLAAKQPTSIETIEKLFPNIPIKALDTFLEDMCAKHLMFRENDQILSLAVQWQ